MGNNELIPSGAAPEVFTRYPENFWTALFAAGLLRARSAPQGLAEVPVWWKEQQQHDGNLAEVIGPTFEVHVCEAWRECGSSPDLRIESPHATLVVETKVLDNLSSRQMELFDRMAGLANSKAKVYLLLAPDGWGEGTMYPGRLHQFYQRGSNTKVRAGFLSLAKTASWAWSLLQLGSYP